MTDPIDGASMQPGVFTSVEEARRKIMAKDHPELVAADEGPEG